MPITDPSDLVKIDKESREDEMRAHLLPAMTAARHSAVGQFYARCLLLAIEDRDSTIRSLTAQLRDALNANHAAETRSESRRDRIATIVQLIRNGHETADEVAARLDSLLP